MGAILKSMALTALPPYGGTFLIFSDLARSAIRFATLMRTPVTFIFTHDSIFLVEDGPTHQPIEHLAVLRAIPNLMLIRPADANETAIARRVAIEWKDGPVALALTRQKLPIIDRTQRASTEGLSQGAYILADVKKQPPQILLIATGSEVSVALKAYEQLSEQQIGARVSVCLLGTSLRGSRSLAKTKFYRQK
jgi:transketolase